MAGWRRNLLLRRDGGSSDGGGRPSSSGMGDSSAKRGAPSRRGRTARSLIAVLGTGAVVAGLMGAGRGEAGHEPAGYGSPPVKSPVATGYGGAVSSVDADASAAGIEVLKNGGTAADAAVATAAALGVTEPYSAGVGGGGYLVYYDAAGRKVHTIDGRETAPLSADTELLTENGKAIPFGQAVTSGLGVGTPGTPATWEKALRAYGNKSLAQTLRPATRLAKRGFAVDETFRKQTAENEDRFHEFPADRGPVPAGRQVARGRLHPQEPRPGPHLPGTLP